MNSNANVRVDGGAGNDHIEGLGGGDHILAGGDGNDHIIVRDGAEGYGENGNDVLIALGASNNYLDGGLGANRYSTAKATGHNTIIAGHEDLKHDSITGGHGFTTVNVMGTGYVTFHGGAGQDYMTVSNIDFGHMLKTPKFTHDVTFTVYSAYTGEPL